MKNLMTPLMFSAAVMLSMTVFTVNAEPRAENSNGKAMAKLQAMVKEATTARDALKTEKEKLEQELTQVKKEKSQSESAEDQLRNDLAAKSNSLSSTANTLEQTNAKLLEVIEKYNGLNKAKTELNTEHEKLKSVHTQTESYLQSCETKNLKLYEAGKEILYTYQNKNVVDSLLKADPIFQFNSVEMEGIVQEYEEKLRKQIYTKNNKQ